MVAAYYAHWAAKRGKHLLSGGGSNDDLLQISGSYMKKDIPSMFFV
jgi:hypothetical protein